MQPFLAQQIKIYTEYWYKICRSPDRGSRNVDFSQLLSHSFTTDRPKFYIAIYDLSFNYRAVLSDGSRHTATPAATMQATFVDDLCSIRLRSCRRDGRPVREGRPGYGCDSRRDADSVPLARSQVGLVRSATGPSHYRTVRRIDSSYRTIPRSHVRAYVLSVRSSPRQPGT